MQPNIKQYKPLYAQPRAEASRRRRDTMTGHHLHGYLPLRAPCHYGAHRLSLMPAGDATDRTPAWMLAPRGVRRPYLTDPPAFRD